MTAGPERSDFTLEEHRHRFAVWAAARASQRGSTTVGRLRGALEASGLRDALADQRIYEIGAAEFDNLHRLWCRAICSHLAAAGVPRVSYGRAAKLVAVYLKSMVLMGVKGDTSLARTMHPPIDRILLQAIAKQHGGSPHAGAWRRTNWTHLDEQDYFTLVGQLRALVTTGEPFWMIEQHWQPSEVDKEDGSRI